MSKKKVRPSTIDGIKRLAKNIKATEGSAHAESLDAAAVAAGFENYAHARRQLQKSEELALGHLAYISVPRGLPSGPESGQEVIEVRLGSPLAELVSSADLRKAPHFMRFRFLETDHLGRASDDLPQTYARQIACAAARTLDFMDATKLRPMLGDARDFPTRDRNDFLPDHEHSTMWYDPATATRVLVDEPYRLSYGGIPAERLAWADRNGFEIVRPAWRGMHNPFNGCEMYLVAEKSSRYDLHAARVALDALPVRFDERRWQGRSEPPSPRFRSLVRQNSPDALRSGGEQLV